MSVRLTISPKTWVLADQLVVSGTSFVTMLLLAHALPVGAFGIFAALLLIQLFMLSIQNALVTSPCLVLLMHFEANINRRYIDSLFVLEIGFCVLLALLALVLHFLRPAWLQFPDAGLSTGMIIGYLLQDFLRRLFIAKSTPERAFWIDMLNNVLQLVLLLAFRNSRALTLHNGVLVIGLTFLPSIGLGIWWLEIRRPAIADVRHTLALHLSEGGWLLLTALLQWWSGNAFIVAAGLWLSSLAFAALRLAQNLFGVLNVLFLAFENYALPTAARISGQSQTLLVAYLRRTMAKSSLIILPLLGLAAFFHRGLFLLTGGERYSEYFGLIPWLCVLYLLIFLGFPIRMAVRVLRLNRLFFTGYLISSLFGMLAARQFVHWWGAKGVILGLIATQVLLISYWFFSMKKNLFIYGDHTCSSR